MRSKNFSTSRKLNVLFLASKLDFPRFSDDNRTPIPETRTREKPHKNKDIFRVRHGNRHRLYYAPLATPPPPHASRAASFHAA